MSQQVTLPRHDAHFILDTLETVEAEVEALVLSQDWFASDSLERIKSAKQILYTELGIKEIEDDDEVEQESFELRFDE